MCPAKAINSGVGGDVYLHCCEASFSCEQFCIQKIMTNCKKLIRCYLQVWYTQPFYMDRLPLRFIAWQPYASCHLLQ